jgi:peptidoglycan/LPS O-acetylase OafA/YrhL
MTLSSFLDRAVRPAALGCLFLVGVGAAFVLGGESTPQLRRYPEVFWVAWGVAAALLALTTVLPARQVRRFRVVGLGGSGILIAVLYGNDYTTGLTRTLFLGAGLIAVLVAVPAVVALFDSARNRPAQRL